MTIIYYPPGDSNRKLASELMQRILNGQIIAKESLPDGFEIIKGDENEKEENSETKT